jgi:hypothetical protein
MNSSVVKHFTPSDFHMFEHMRRYIAPNGDMVVPSTREHIIYGPYLKMVSGVYVIQPKIHGEDKDEILGEIEICDNGVILKSAKLTRDTLFTARLPDIEGLEIRIRANDIPFTLAGIMLVHLPDEGRAHNNAAINAADVLLKTLKRVDFDITVETRNLEEISRKYSNYDALFAAINGSVESNWLNEVVSDLSFDDGFNLWLTRRPATKIIDVWDGHLLSNAVILNDLGFDLEATRIASSDLHHLNAIYAQQSGEVAISKQLSAIDDEYDTSSSTLFSELRRVQGGFSKLAASSGRAFTTCPFTGRTVSTQHCLAIPHSSSKQVFLFYRFSSTYTFYIIVNGFSGSKQFLYVPEKNVLLRLHTPAFEWGEAQDPVNQFVKLTMCNSRTVYDYLKSDTRTAVLSGTLENVGHFFWNEASGVVKYASEGYLDKVRVGISFKHAYLDPFGLIDDALIPERLRADTAEDVFNMVLTSKLFCVRPIECQVTPEVSSRLQKLSARDASPLQISQSEEARRSDYLLWVALRSHNKVWVNQVDGLCSVIDHLADEYMNVSVYVDGTPDCEHYQEELRRRIPANVKLFSGINVSIYDTVMWSFKIDSYIATIGSGLTFVTWIAGKPGVAHAEKHHLGQMSFWGGVRPDVPMPLTPSAEEVQDIGGGSYCNYEIAPEVIMKLFSQIPLPKR